MHLLEAFRNIISCGSEQSYIQASAVKGVETDPPFLVRKRRDALQQDANATNNNANIPTQKDQTEVNTTATGLRSIAFTPTPNLGEVTNWKTNKQDQLLSKRQCLKDQKLAFETHIRELELDVVEPPQVGNYRIICGNCHVRGHRADGNQRNDSCKAPLCTSLFSCGQRKKHPEHFDEIRKMKKQLKEIVKEIESVTMERVISKPFSRKAFPRFQ